MRLQHATVLTAALLLLLGAGCAPSGTGNGGAPPEERRPSQDTEPVSPIAKERSFDAAHDRGGDVYRLRFTIPAGWEVEYVPEIQSLNLFTLSGDGTSRDRSKVFIRFFDADRFLTLSTVTVHRAEDRVVGIGGYTARTYDIEKKPGVTDFPGQPAWRNQRHLVTDFRGETGRTRYYVVAGSPSLDAATYEMILASMEIIR